MPRITQDDLVVDWWNSLHNPNIEQAKKFLEILKKVLTSNK
jgi:hypothetical protein